MVMVRPVTGGTVSRAARTRDRPQARADLAQDEGPDARGLAPVGEHAEAALEDTAGREREVDERAARVAHAENERLTTRIEGLGGEDSVGVAR